MEMRKRKQELYDQLESPQEYAHFMMANAVNDDRLKAVISTLIVAEKYASRNLGITGSKGDKETLARYIEWIESLKSTAKIQQFERKKPE